MSKTITIKLKKAGNKTKSFSISDNFGNVLSSSTSKSDLIFGVSFVIDDNVTVITLSSISEGCCYKSWNIPISQLNIIEIAAIKFQPENTSSLWKHLTSPLLYNNFYGCIAPYIIEYPFAYQYYDEIVQNIKDYTKVLQIVYN